MVEEVAGSRSVAAAMADWRGPSGVWRAVTPLGRTVLGLGALAFVIFLFTGWEELAVVAAACVVSLLIGVMFLFLGRTSLRVGLELITPRVVAGETASTGVEATNEASRRMLPVRLETRVGRGVTHVQVPALAAGESHDEAVLIPTTRRSVVPIGPVRSVQGDPLGLVRREIQWTGTETLFVHPRTVVLRPLTSGFLRDLEGHATNDRSPSDIAFHTLREYVIGDDRRHIHWRTTARQADGKLMVREFVDTRRAHVGLVVSARAADYRDADEFELAMSVVASVGRRAFADEQDLVCMVGHRMLPTHNAPAFLDALASIEMGEDDQGVGVVAARARSHLAAVSVLGAFTGSAGDEVSARAAVDAVGSTAAAFVVVAATGAEAGLAATAGSPVVTVGALDDLPRLMAASVR